ncbi:MAG: HlyD family efflux transporter periplasmic adaptor subunit [Planctomycetota bacterium]
MKNWIIWGVLLAAIIAAAVYVQMSRGVVVRVAAVEQGKISAYVDERARTSLPRVIHLTMPLDGRIKAISLLEGQEVKKGEAVAMLDDSDLKTSAAEAQARLDEIGEEIKVNQFRAIEELALRESKGLVESVTDMLGAAVAKVKGSEAKLGYAKVWAESTEKLHQGDVASALGTKQAKTEFATARVELEADRFMQHAMEVTERLSKFWPQYVTNYLVRKDLQQNVLKKKLEGAKAALEKSQRDLGRAAILSPIDGVVLKRHVWNERALSAGAALLDLGGLEDLEVTADVLSEDVINVKVGDPADIYGPSIGATPIHGTVSRIKPEGFTKVSSLGVEQQRVSVIIAISQDDMKALKDARKTLGVAYQVRVRIYTATHENIAKIPRTALFRGSGGAWRAFVVRGNRAELVDVQVGLTNDIEAEIASGLTAGDLVVIAPEAALTSGARVNYDKP